MNLKRILMSVAVVGVIGALVYSTGAFFSDEEVSEGNTFAAGEIDLKIDATAHYAGMVCTQTDQGPVWQDEDAVSENNPRPDLLGKSCDGTWTLRDLTENRRFFDLTDVKPGDEGENTISYHVYSNDAYMCAYIENMQDDDNGLTEPEEEAGDTTGGVGEGELADELRFFAWADTDGDNIWESGELPLFSNTEGPASDVIDGVVYPLWTPQVNGALAASTNNYIGLYWCYGDLTVGDNTLTCDGEGGTNRTQTDSLSADIRFYVEQARNNSEFVCPPLPLPEAQVVEATTWSLVDTDVNDDGVGGKWEWLAKAKVQEPNPASDFELQVGVSDTDNTLFSQNDTVWTDAHKESFTLTYDGVGTAALEVDGHPTTTYPVGPGTYGRLGITLRAPADATTTVENLSLDLASLSVTSKSVSNGTNSLTILGIDLSSGFELSGDFTFDWGTLTSNGENQKVQFSID